MNNSKEFQFTWKIENFSMLPHKNKEYLDSTFFSTPIFDGTEFFLSLYPRGDIPESENYLSCFLGKKRTDVRKITIGFSLKLESIDGSNDKTKTASSVELMGPTMGYTKFVELKIINENKSLYLPNGVLTMKCKIWDPKNKARANKLSGNLLLETAFTECSSITRIQSSKQSVIWPITLLQGLLESKEKVSFFVGSPIKTHPSFKLSFYIDDDPDLEHAKIEITQTKSFPAETNIFVKCKITVLSAQKEYQHSQTDTYSFDSDVERVWYFPQFIEITHLEKEKYIHLDDTLYLSCEFSFTTKGDPLYHIEIPRYTHSAFDEPKSALVTNLSNRISELYMDSQFCDVTLQVNNNTFPAYKVVLCAQSPVFCAMFKNDMKEKNTNVIEITDVDVVTIELMLDFVHSDILEEGLSTDDICKLYSAADKYQISQLKQKCTCLLLSTLSVAEVCKVLIIADRHQDDFLMFCVHDFVKCNATEVFHSSQWEEFNNENPILSGKIMLQVWKST